MQKFDQLSKYSVLCSYLLPVFLTAMAVANMWHRSLIISIFIFIHYTWQ